LNPTIGVPTGEFIAVLNVLAQHNSSPHENQIEQAQVRERTHSPIKAMPA
jgi:hypothetical protein